MSETTPTSQPTETPAEGATPNAETTLGDAGKKAIAEERTARKAAEDAIKALQAQLDEAKRSQMSDLEKAQATAAEAQATAEKAARDALRWRTAAKHGLSDEDADLFLTGSDAETIERQATALAARTPTGPKPDPSQGAKGAAAAKTTADSFAEFFRNQI
jgi:hypothetical protein